MVRHQNHNIQIKLYFLLRSFFDLANSVDPDEMLHDAAFHPGLHCLQKMHLRVTIIKRSKPRTWVMTQKAS